MRTFRTVCCEDLAEALVAMLVDILVDQEPKAAAEESELSAQVQDLDVYHIIKSERKRNGPK